jgi:hypothetical protein
MLRVEFITSESEQDLIVSFAIASAANRSLTLLRSPQYEHLLLEEERGATVAPLDPEEVETDFLVSVQWLGARVVVKTQRHEYKLDISAVAENEVAEAKAVLRKMVKDGSAHVDGA